jgi:phosphatidylserine/phosphatidylglycerophosphate/cardiolipin synthase-like enzyme
MRRSPSSTAIAITGRFNWSENAEERSDENIVVLRDRAWAEAFENQFTLVWNHGD